MKKLSKKETGRTLGDSGHPIWKQEEQSVTHEVFDILVWHREILLAML